MDRTIYETDYIYVVGSSYHNQYKIGWSLHPAERVKGLQTGCPFEIELCHIIATTSPLEGEKYFKKEYREYRINPRREWYHLPAEALKEIFEITHFSDGKLININIHGAYGYAWDMLSENPYAQNPFPKNNPNHEHWNSGAHDLPIYLETQLRHGYQTGELNERSKRRYLHEMRLREKYEIDETKIGKLHEQTGRKGEF